MSGEVGREGERGNKAGNEVQRWIGREDRWMEGGKGRKDGWTKGR